MNATSAWTAGRGRIRGQKGFTLVELMMVIGIVGVLATIALPVYQRYLERAHLASVIVEIDALRTEAQIVASENGRDLCEWRRQTSAASGQSDVGRQLDSLIKQTRASLDPKLWDQRYVYPGYSTDGQAFTVQFGAQGDLAGVARARLLAEELQKAGLFAEWKRNTAGGAIFTVHLGSCSAQSPGTGPGTVSPTVTTPTITPPSMPASTLPVVVPPHGAASTPSLQPIVAPPVPVVTAPASTPMPVVPSKPLVGSSANAPGQVASAPSANGPTAMRPPPLAASVAAPVHTPAQTLGQCQAQCRATHPHGNSNAYRTCIQNCGSP